MLKLIYHNAAFGPIDLEYERSVIRVGSSEDNDLVLRHPSIEPHHCSLVFRNDVLVWLAPNLGVSEEWDLGTLTGPEFRAGDRLQIGELQFDVARSAKTVTIPLAGPPAGTKEDPSAEPGYFCPRCRVTYRKTDLKRMGLVGHAKRWLCPRCSHVFEVEPEPAAARPSVKPPSAPPPSRLKWLRASTRPAERR